MDQLYNEQIMINGQTFEKMVERQQSLVEADSWEKTLQDARVEKGIMTEKKMTQAERAEMEAGLQISHRVTPLLSNMSLRSPIQHLIGMP